MGAKKRRKNRRNDNPQIERTQTHHRPEAPEKEPLFRAVMFLSAAALGATPFVVTVEADFRGVMVLATIYLLCGALLILHTAVRSATTAGDKVEFHRPGVLLPLFFFVIIAGASAFSAAYLRPALVNLYLWFGGGVFLAVLIRLFRNRAAATALVAVILASALAVSMHGIHQKFVDLPAARALFLDDPEGVMDMLGLPDDLTSDMRGRMGIETNRVKDRVFSTFLHPTTLSGYFALLLPLIFGLIVDSLKSGRRLAAGVNIAAGLFIAWCLYETRSKGGMAALAIIALALGVWGFWMLIGRIMPGRSARFHNAVVAGLGLAAAGCVLAVYLIAQGAGYLPPARDFGGSFIVRAGYWRATAQMFREGPVLGIGQGNFADYYQMLKRPEDQDARQAHNDYLQILAEAGILGLAAFIWIWVAFYRRIFSPLDPRGDAPRGEQTAPRAPPEERSNRAGHVFIIIAAALVAFGMEWSYGRTFSSGADIFFWLWPLIIMACWTAYALFNVMHLPAPLGRWTKVGAIAGVSAFLLHSAVEFNFQVPGMRNTLFAVVALGLGMVRLPVARLKIGSGMLGAAAMCSVAGVAGAWFLFARPMNLAEEYFERAHLIRSDTIDGTPMDQLRLLESARELDPRNAQYPGATADLYYIFSERSESPDGAVSALVLSLRSALDAAEKNPVRSIHFERIGRCYRRGMRWGRMDTVDWSEHVSDFLRRSSLARDEEFARRALDLFERPKERALEAYMRAEELFPSDPRSVWEVARMLDEMGDHEAARERYERALDLKDRQYSHTAVRLTGAEILWTEERLEELGYQ